MKKIILLGVLSALLILLTPSVASALSVVPQEPASVTQWYKSVSFNLSGSCLNTSHQFSGSLSYSTNGAGWMFNFMTDTYGNPYYFVAGSGATLPQPAMTPFPCNITAQPYTGPQQFGPYSIDSQSPVIGLSDPTSNISTSASSYAVKGGANDTLSGLKSVVVNDGNSSIPATLNGLTFSVTVPLNVGDNNISATATDNAGNTSTSSTVVITRTSTTTGGGTSGSSGGGSSSSGGSSSGGSSSSGSTSSSTPTSTSTDTSSNSSNQSSSPQIVKFNLQQVLNLKDPYANQESSSPADVQANAALAGATGKTYYVLIGSIIILFGLCALVIYQFRPVFMELDQKKSGLRRRIILIVTLPSILPLLGLGFLGYQQLSTSVKNSLSSQLESAAQTDSLKLYREFSIRQIVISKTASDILQIKSQYADQQAQLSSQETSCQQIVKTDIPAKQYSKVTSDSNCLPFLTGFAQLASSTSATVNDYLSALSQGASQASSDLTAQENQRVNELLGSVRDFFPDVLELDVLKTGGGTTPLATLPRTDTKQASLVQSHKDVLAQASSGALALLDASKKPTELILTYPIIDGKKTEGAAVVSIDVNNQYFIPSIWQSTPKPYKSDQVYFITTSGELVIPTSSDKQLLNQIKPLSGNSAGKVYNLKLANQTLATRTTPVATTNWMVAVGAPSSTILAPLAGVQRTAILAIVGFILLSVLLGIWFVSRIAGEIESLFQGAITFAKGDLDHRIRLKSHDELQVLGDTMNQMADDIKAAQKALVEKDKEFINVATHELKAPMTSILGNLSMITQDGMGKVDTTARELIDQAYSGTVRLRNIVTDMLDIARLESGHAEFKLEPLDIRKITGEIVSMQLIIAKQTSLSLEYQPPQTLPSVVADKNKLQIILTNFVSNAIKYNRPGGTITVTHQLSGEQLTTAVADSGLGIPADQQAHIFEKFYRVKHDDRANVPGTGLGMYITKRFVEAMGGKVWFTSVHGKGTTFYFNLPIQKVAGTAAPVVPKPSSETTPPAAKS